jgi:hypothetical protein
VVCNMSCNTSTMSDKVREKLTTSWNRLPFDLPIRERKFLWKIDEKLKLDLKNDGRVFANNLVSFLVAVAEASIRYCFPRVRKSPL